MSNEAYLDEILEKISINPAREQQIRSVIKKTMTKFGKRFPDYQNYRIKGSFKRSTNIRGRFDVDVYVVGTWREDQLLKSFYTKVKRFVSSENDIDLLRHPPYQHAIPVLIHDDLEVDLLTAIDKGQGIYVIPEGYQKLIKTKPKQFENDLTTINRSTNGMTTKLIRLLKLWNSLHGKVFRSYQIERLVEDIFRNSNMSLLSDGLNHFFNQARHFIQQNRTIYDELKQEDVLAHLNRNEASSLLEESAQFAQNNQFSRLFPTI